MCADSRMQSNEHSDLILELGVSFARLHRNQTKPGYVVVILNEHVCELPELDAGRRAQFWDDVAVVGRAITDAFAPVKLDNLIMGHRCPHLHCHVYPSTRTTIHSAWSTFPPASHDCHRGSRASA